MTVTEAGQEHRQSVSDSERSHEVPSILQWAIPLLVHRRIIVLIPVATAILTVAVTLALPKKYTTSISFTPVQSDAAAGALAGLAGQIGLSLPTGDLATSPDFYARLLRTNDILLELAKARYVVPVGADTLRGNFLELYEISEGDEGRSFSKAIEVLSSRVLSIGFDRQTSMVSVDVRTKWRALSYQMATILLDRVNEFNLRSRQARAGAEERFLRLRLDTARVELRNSENRLQSFLVSNRTYQSDPMLTFEFNRLERELMLRQSVYSTLIQSYEGARLAAVRNTPSLSIVEQPRPAFRFDRRRTLTKAILGFAAGLVLALAYVGAIGAYHAAESSPGQSGRLRSLITAAADDLRRLFPFGTRRRASSR